MSSDNLIYASMMPVEVMGKMTDMYKEGRTYEVMVDDRLNPGARTFAFGLNGKIGEYPTNTRIRLLGEEIQHLYNCIAEETVTEEAGEGRYRRVVGKRQVCRFSITPTSWDALPERAVLLGLPGTKVYREDTAKTPIQEMPDELKQAISEAGTGKDVSVDEMMGARENELASLSYNDLKELAKERDIKYAGVSKVDLIENILGVEEKLLRGEE